MFFQVLVQNERKNDAAESTGMTSKGRQVKIYRLLSKKQLTTIIIMKNLNLT